MVSQQCRKDPVALTDDGSGRRTVGRRGEEIAAKYLMDSGHTIVARNWRKGHLEVDIISMDGDGVHFVEVKSRTAPSQAEPEVNVGPAKRSKLVSAARKWLKDNGEGDVDIRFDVVSVLFDGDSYELNYFPDAFIPLYF